MRPLAEALADVRDRRGTHEHGEWLEYLAALEREKQQELKGVDLADHPAMITIIAQIQLLDTIQQDAVREKRASRPK